MSFAAYWLGIILLFVVYVVRDNCVIGNIGNVSALTTPRELAY